jgi:hypothetical protein
MESLGRYYMNSSISAVSTTQLVIWVCLASGLVASISKLSPKERQESQLTQMYHLEIYLTIMCSMYGMPGVHSEWKLYEYSPNMWVQCISSVCVCVITAEGNGHAYVITAWSKWRRNSCDILYSQ